MLNNSVTLSRIFSAVNDRHSRKRHNASYDVCRNLLCRVAFWLEKWIWYGGKVG